MPAAAACHACKHICAQGKYLEHGRRCIMQVMHVLLMVTSSGRDKLVSLRSTIARAEAVPSQPWCHLNVK